MALLVPNSVADADGEGTNSLKQKILQEIDAWKKERAIQGNPTASILRYTESGGAPYAFIQPTLSLVADLANLRIAVYNEVARIERKWGVLYEGGDYEFHFYLDSIEVNQTDVIEYDGHQYRVISVEYEEESGLNVVLARKDRDA